MFSRFYLCILLITCMHIFVRPSSPVAYNKIFLDTADKLLQAGDAMSAEIIASSQVSSPQGSDYNRPKKILRHAHFSTLSKKKTCDKKVLRSQNSLLHLNKSTTAYNDHSRESRADIYFNALSFYITCKQKSSPTTSMYIHMQVRHILDILKTIFSPIDLFAPSTLHEPGCKELLITAEKITQEPIIVSSFINNVDQKLKEIEQSLTSAPGNNNTSSVCKKLDRCMKTLLYAYTNPKIEEYQRVIIHAYAEATWHLIKKIPECSTKACIIQELFQPWHTMHQKQPHPDTFLTQINKKIEKHKNILSSPETQQKPDFLNECLKDLMHMINNVMCLHQAHAHNKCQQYWIEKTANKVISLVEEATIPASKNETAVIDAVTLHKQKFDTSTILKHITTALTAFSKTPKTLTKNTELNLEQLSAKPFEMLHILIDIYTEQLISPKLLNTITEALNTIVEFLASDKKYIPSPNEKQLIKSALAIVSSSPRDYALSYYMHYFNTFMDDAQVVQNKTYMHDPLIPDRTYCNILRAYESGISFSPEQLSELENFAELLHMPLPKKILTELQFLRISAEKNRELQKLTGFVQQVFRHISLESQASSSMHS